jgi:hypothetical protein
MVQSFNAYPPNFAIYLIGRALMPQGQSIKNMFNGAAVDSMGHRFLYTFILSIVCMRIRAVYNR